MYEKWCWEYLCSTCLRKTSGDPVMFNFQSFFPRDGTFFAADKEAGHKSSLQLKETSVVLLTPRRSWSALVSTWKCKLFKHLWREVHFTVTDAKGTKTSLSCCIKQALPSFIHFMLRKFMPFIQSMCVLVASLFAFLSNLAVSECQNATDLGPVFPNTWLHK